MKRERFHRVATVAQLAFAVAESDDSPPPALNVPPPNAITEKVRAAAHRLRLHHETREVFNLLAEGLATVERELYDLRKTIALERAGLALGPQLICLGADGLNLQRRGPWPENARVHIFLGLRIWQSERLIALTGRVHHMGNDDTELVFERPPPDQHDALVAYCLQQQGMERRRALDASGH